MSLRITVVLCFMVICTIASAQSSEIPITVDFDSALGPMRIDRFSLGQGGLSPEPMFADRTEEIRALKPRVIRLFVQEYFNLLTTSGVYEFKTLDASVDAIVRAGATPLLCVVFKPRRLFPRRDQESVAPTSWKEWEALMYAVVSHYSRRNGRGWYWEVGNEWDLQSGGGTPYHMTPEQYTRFYKHTVTAIRRADPKARVGGPGQALISAPLIPALLAFCDKNPIPLDFISWHGYQNDPQWFRQSIESMHLLLRQHPKLHPQTVIDEWNMDPSLEDVDPRLQPVFIAETTFQMIESGLDLSCYFQIRDYTFDNDAFKAFYPAQDVAEQERFWDRHLVQFGLFDSENQVRPAYFVFKLLERLTGDRIALKSGSNTMHGLATNDNALGVSSILLWNYSAKEVDVSVQLHDIPTQTMASRYVLDATGTNNGESARLRPQPTQKLSSGDGSLHFRLAPWGITLVSLEKR